MNWKLVAALAWAGPLMGVLVVLGVFAQGVDRFVWFAVMAGSALMVARREPARPLPHGAVVGFIHGASSTLVQAVFVERLLANNPWMAARLADQPEGFDAEFFVFMLVPFIGVAGGAITGLMSIVAARILAGRRGQSHP